MKIKCNYCGSMFNDTLEKCPNCGAPNEGVVRTTKSQPLTIEQLQGWYHDRGLPPYEKTRFFIGEDYKGPKAFGIYKDKNGKCVVYKNKADGSRAIRYEGTDEAYAVNELFMRLKEEIIEQKNAAAIKRGGGNSPSSSVNRSSSYKSTYTPPPRKKNFWDWYGNLGCFGACSVLLGMLVILVGLIVGVVFGYLKITDEPHEGYYKYEGTYMYYTEHTYGISEDGYIIYDPEHDNWSDIQDRKAGPEELCKNKTAQQYFLASEWNDKLGCPDFLKSQDYLDMSNNNTVDTGYYEYDDVNYYHSVYGRDSGWYEYDSEKDWQPIDASDVPEDLTHYYRAQDFYYTPEWDSDTQISDFRDSAYYVPPSSSDDDDSWWSGGSDYDNDYDYDWDSDYTWDSNDTDWDSDW